MHTARFLAILLAAAAPVIADDAAPALAKAVAAFQKNLANQKHWNWTIDETRELLDRRGDVIRQFPSVSSESVIRSDGRRCNAVTAWGDGRAPYMKDADPDERCQAYDALGTPFDVALLLTSETSKLEQHASSKIRIAVAPDKSRLKDKAYAVRCAASIKGTIELDPATYFPLAIEGEVVETGCNTQFVPVIQYGSGSRQPLSSQFRKGATFRVEYALQKDRFDNPENSFWISTLQKYVTPWNTDLRLLYYWGREFGVPPNGGTRLVKEIRTRAQEFGAGSVLKVGGLPPPPQ